MSRGIARRPEEERERSRRDELRYRMLVRFGARLRGAVRLRPLLALIAGEARDVLGAERCTIFLVDEARRELWTPVAHGLESRDLRVPLGRGIVGRVVASGRPLRVDDAHADPRFDPSFERATGYRARSILAVPLIDPSGRAFGAFEVLNKRRGPFDAEDEDLLRILGTLAGAAVESARLYEELRDSYLETVHRLARTAEFRDARDTGPHLRRIGRYSKILALAAGLPEARAEDVECASLLHDIGKVGVPDSVLRKAGRLTPREFARMKEHPRIGWEILSDAKSPLLRLAAEVALAHHERWDGGGYPRGLKGDALTLEVQLVALADVLDALTAERVYKPAWTFDASARYIAAQAGRAFRPDAVAAFRRALPRLREAWRELREPAGAAATARPSRRPRRGPARS
ncbi:MAG: HD domain-containing protein [Elusimicrobia bacterium]|nr:HD domain-containing protein [Elusimicrobiota bacterium]